MESLKYVVGSFLQNFDEPHEKFAWNIVILIIYSIINYFVLVKYEEQDLSIDQIIYFTSITHFTVGFGDITPKTTLGRIVTISHVILSWFITFVPAINISKNAGLVLAELPPVAGNPGKRFSLVTDLGQTGPAMKYVSSKVSPL